MSERATGIAREGEGRTKNQTVVEREVAAEQSYVDTVYERLEEMANSARSVAAEGIARGQLDAVRGVKWDDYSAFFTRDALVYNASRQLARIDAEHSGLVFGRLDFRDLSRHYVGRLGVRDESYEPLVIDWRAPAASVFYEATAAHPMDVVRRRVLRSRGSTVVGVEDDLLDADHLPEGMPVVGDGALIGALSAARTGQMRDIVATIQHEQDQAIRAPARAATLITGGPGTGKTVVALHRAAFLLYSDRRRFEGGGVLVVGPSAGFMRYIESVLPSLGERSVTLRSVGEVLDETDVVRHDPPAVARLKGSSTMAGLCSALVRDRVAGAPGSFRMFVEGTVVDIPGRELDWIRRRLLSNGSVHNAVRAEATRAVLTAAWRQVADDPPRGMDSDEFTADLLRRGEFAEFMQAWWPLLTPTDVLRWLADTDRLAALAGDSLTAEQVRTLAGSFGPQPSIEDVPLLDELRIGLGVPKLRSADVPEDTDERLVEVTTTSDRLAAENYRGERPDNYDEYAHILVDEAQDLSPMQWRMIGRRGRYASWTIVGDAAQSSWPERAETEAARDAALGRLPRQEFLMTTNYRNSAEIFDFASHFIRRLVPDADIPQAVRHTGIAPDHRVVPDPAAAVPDLVAELRDLVAGTIGVIAPSGSVDPLRSSVGPDPRVSVVNALDCKGLEYDAVVIVSPDEILAESAMGERILYVALTRATQRLVTLARSAGWRGRA